MIDNYLEAAKNVQITLHTTEGEQYVLEGDSVERPDQTEIEDICQRKEYGEVNFTDKTRITAEEEVHVWKAELHYSEHKVAEREFPEIVLYEGDTLELTWSFNIDNAIPTPKELMEKADIPEKLSDEETKGVASQVYIDNLDVVQDYRNGRDSALNHLVGKVMDKSEGCADAELASEHLKKLIQV